MDEKELYRLLSFLRMSEHRQKILQFLNEQENAQTPTDIASAIDVHRNHISNQLRKLRDEELVTLLNPEAARHRYYRITDRGKMVLEKLQEMEDE